MTLLVMALLLLTACGSAEAPPRVLVLDSISGLSVDIGQDELTLHGVGLSELGELRPGDLLVSSQGSGFLRRVVGVESSADGLRVATVPATLAEAVEDADLAGHLETGASNGKDDSLSLRGIDFSLGEVDDLGDRGVDLRIKDGHLRFAPTLDVDLSIRGRKLEYFTMEAGGWLEADISLDAVVAGQIDKYFFRKLYSVPYVFVQMIGEVPVVEVVELSVGVGIGVRAAGRATIHLDGRVAGNLLAAARLEQGEWQTSGEPSFEMAQETTVSDAEGEVEVSAFLFGTVEVRFYDAAGPAFRLAPYFSVTRRSDDPAWYPRVGVKGFLEAQVVLPIVHRGWTPYRRELFDLGQDLEPIRPDDQSAAPVDECGGVDQAGSCSAGVAVRCQGGQLEIRDCPSEGKGCGVDGGGRATCVSGCGGLDFYGACFEYSLRWCEDGVVHAVSCDSGCGWQDDAVGYACW